MATLQTFFRAVVMLATLGLIAKVWYHYGPSAGELRVIGTRAAQVASEAWNEFWQTPAPSTSRTAGPPPPAPFAPLQGEAQPMPRAAEQAGPLERSDRPVRLAAERAESATPAAPGLLAPSRLPPTASLEPLAASQADQRLQTALDELAELGVRDPQVSAWGSREEMVRFTCCVPWGSSPSYTRQFEAVAATPLDAVRQVADQIAAWQRAE